MLTPQLRLQGNVQSLFDGLQTRAHKIRCLTETVDGFLTSHQIDRLPLAEGRRIQGIALVASEEVERLVEELDAAHAFYTKIEKATAQADPVFDPFLDALRRYQVELASVNAAPEGTPDEAVNAADEAARTRLFSGPDRTPPAITSMAGAIAGIRQVFAENAIIDTTAEKLLRAVLSYLEGRAAP